MHLLLLGGNQPTNLPWLNQLGRHLQADFDEVVIHHYHHWENRQPLIDLEAEAQAIEQQKLGPPLLVVAKSAGVLLAAKLISSGRIRASGAVLIGTPLGWANQHGFPARAWLSQVRVPMVFMQHTQDPSGSAAELQNLLSTWRVSPYSFVELPGNSHHYPELEAIRATVVSLKQEVSKD